MSAIFRFVPKNPPGQTRNRIFLFVRGRLLRGDSPSLREIGDHFGFRAVETVRAHLAALVAEGRLIKEPGRSRGYRLPLVQSFPGSALLRFQSIPILGEVPAGGGEEAIQNPEGSVPMEIPETRDPSDFFAFRVRDESMTGAGILPGDLVIVESGIRAVSGQIVVALVGDEATVKTLYLGPSGMELRPQNHDFETLRPPPDSCRILGIVMELRRRIR